MKKHLALLLGVLIPAVSLIPVSQRPAPLKVVTSIFPLREFAKEIAGDRAEVSLLLPPGAGVHTWQPRASDILRLSAADLFAAELPEIDPSSALFFQAGAARLKERLTKLDASYSQGLGRCASKALVVGGHAAFGYLAKRDGLEQLSLSGLSPDAEALP